MGLKNNMLIAAEACFEMDPSPIHEAWLKKLNSEEEESYYLCNICATRSKVYRVKFGTGVFLGCIEMSVHLHDHLI